MKRGEPDKDLVRAPEPDHLARARRGEATLSAVLRDEVALQDEGRRFLGIVGKREHVPFRAAISASECRWYEAGVLWALAFADALVEAELVAQTSNVQLNMSSGALGPLTALRPAVFVIGGVFGLTVLRRYFSRASCARAAALTSGVGLLSIALSVSTWVMLLAALVVSLASGVLAAVLLPMLFDVYHPAVRVRVMGGYVAAIMLGIGLGGVIASIDAGLGYTWRAALLVASLFPLVASAAALRLSDPSSGRWDRNRLAYMVERRLGGGRAHLAVDSSPAGVKVSLARKFQQVLACRSGGAILTAASLFGVIVWGFQPSVEVFLRDRWGLVSQSRSTLIAVLLMSTVPGVIWFASKGEALYRQSPRRLMLVTSSWTLLAGVALVAATVAPWFWLTMVLFWVSFTGFATLLVTSAFMLLTLCDPALRGHAAVLLGALVLFGSQSGPQIVNTIASRFGIEWGLVLFVFELPIVAAAQLRRSVREVNSDVDNVVGAIVEAHELATRVSLGHHLPLLSCRNIDFSYGHVQVLFKVSLTVDDGEMVALLGTNGAGKSTLLRLISGLALPSSGSIHYLGSDITLVESDRRVGLGISQIPGGRAVFGPLTVMDNLRAYGHTLSRNRALFESRVEEAFAAFPGLAERRDQLASTLSGGERQMLALAAAFLLKPRLLVIDELSLGLAPIIVGQLLEMIRRINASGTAVVLVEQSVNVALSVVDHAYFMEKGEVRFDGTARELMDRPDLLRSVFLKGATEGLKTPAQC